MYLYLILPMDYQLFDYTAWTPLEKAIYDIKQDLIRLKELRACKERKEAILSSSMIEWTTSFQSTHQLISHGWSEDLDVISLKCGDDSERKRFSEDEARHWLSVLIMAAYGDGCILERPLIFLIPTGRENRFLGKMYACNEQGQLSCELSLYIMSEKHLSLLKQSDLNWIKTQQLRLNSFIRKSNIIEVKKDLILESCIEYVYRLVNWYDIHWRNSLPQECFSFKFCGINTPFFLTWGPRQDPLEHIDWIRYKTWKTSLVDWLAALDNSSHNNVDFSTIMTPPSDWQQQSRWKVMFRPFFYVKTPLKDALYQLWKASLWIHQEETVELRFSLFPKDEEDKNEEAQWIPSIQHILQTEYYSQTMDEEKSDNKDKENDQEPRQPLFKGNEEEDGDDDDNVTMNRCRKITMFQRKVAQPYTITYLITLHLLNQCQQVTQLPRWLSMMRQWWQLFTQEVRWHWEQRVTLCNIETPPVPDYQRPLLHQKFQLLQYCISRCKQTSSYPEEKKQAMTTMITESSSSPTLLSSLIAEEEEFFEAVEHIAIQEKENTTAMKKRGILKRLSNVVSQSTGKFLYIPISLDPGFKTEDQVEEEQTILSNLGTSPEAGMIRARMQSGQLLSGKFNRYIYIYIYRERKQQLYYWLTCLDMAAFKAANIGCCLEDFVRWHSPSDWIKEESRLSDRMASMNNLWRELWDLAEEKPACEQLPLFDCEQEAEKILHYLETLPLNELFYQLWPTALAIVKNVFKQSIDTLLACKTSWLHYFLASLDVEDDDKVIEGGEEEIKKKIIDRVHTLECRLSMILSLRHKVNQKRRPFVG
jgi:hypothetical protein